MVVYRITKRTRANDLTGTGAALYPGRWNKQGTPVIYAGESKEIALLENLVHIPPMLTPELDIVTLEIPGDSITELKPDDLPSNWYRFPAPTVLSKIGQDWVDENESLFLKVPSSIIHSVSNYILNCKHPWFGSVKILEQKAFYLDTRLLK